MNNATEQPTGFLLVDKPAGITSHDVIDRLRKITGIKKIGHAGTLDPFATGLLLVAIGREATREISTFVGMDKTYEAEFVLGATTETLDPESPVIYFSGSSPYQGEVRRGLRIQDHPQPLLSKEGGRNIRLAMTKLTGEIEQIPPMHSAIKVKGRKLYKLARQGKEIKREPRKITIHQFDLLDEPQKENDLIIIKTRIDCSSGTYIRALARDLGNALGTTGYVRQLRRIKIGNFDVKNTRELDEIDLENWPTLLKTLENMQIDE